MFPVELVQASFHENVRETMDHVGELFLPIFRWRLPMVGKLPVLTFEGCFGAEYAPNLRFECLIKLSTGPDPLQKMTPVDK